MKRSRNRLWIETYVIRTNLISRANCCLGGRGSFFDVCRFADQTKYRRAPAQRTQFHYGPMDVIRMAIAGNRDIAELMTEGLRGERALDAADQLRLEQMLQEYAWASFHIWDRTQRGVFPKGTFEATAGPLLSDVLSTARGGTWWHTAKHVGFLPGFVRDVDAVLDSKS